MGLVPEECARAQRKIRCSGPYQRGPLALNKARGPPPAAPPGRGAWERLERRKDQAPAQD
jgi:hypothetical protein